MYAAAIVCKLIYTYDRTRYGTIIHYYRYLSTNLKVRFETHGKMLVPPGGTNSSVGGTNSSTNGIKRKYPPY